MQIPVWKLSRNIKYTRIAWIWPWIKQLKCQRAVYNTHGVNLWSNLCQKSYCCQKKVWWQLELSRDIHPSAGDIRVVSLRYPTGISSPLSQPSNHHYLPNGHSGANDPWNPHGNPYISFIKEEFFPDQVFFGHQLSTHQDVAAKNFHPLTDDMQTLVQNS